MNRLRAFWRYCLLLMPWRHPSAPALTMKVDCYDAQRQATTVATHGRCAQVEPPTPAPQEPPQPRRSPAAEAPCTPAGPPPAPLEARHDPATASLGPEATTPLPLPSIAPLNRRDRRRLEKWERERRKHDVLVTPAVPHEVPPRKPRAKSDKPKTARPAEPDLPDILENNDALIDGEDGKIYTERELYGEFNFRDTILEQLELYWGYLRRMQHHDAQAYEFYKRLGATIVPPITNFLHQGVTKDEEAHTRDMQKTIKLTPWWKENRPSFGCVTYGISKIIEQQEQQPHWRHPNDKKILLWVPKFFYFTKYERPPPKVAPMSGGDIYKLTIWWDRPFDPKFNYKKGGRPTEYAVLLTKDTIRVLPMLDTKMVSIRRKHNGAHQRRGEFFDVPQRAWRIPEYYTEWAKDRGEDAEHLLARMFMDVARTYEYANYSMVRVAVHNGDLTAQFSIDPRRMSYFFQDREIVYTPGGAREACFHIVRTHMRHTKHGDTPVKFHFRGAKEFMWAGYRVTVTVPERDHIPLSDFDIGTTDDYWIPRADRKHWIDETQIAKRLQHMIETGKYDTGDDADEGDQKQQ